MGDYIFIGLIVLAIAAFIGGMVAMMAWIEKKRSESLQLVADQLGLAFLPNGDVLMMEQLQHMRLMKQGHARRLTNLISGETDDLRLSIFDYQYTIGGGKNSHTYKQTVAALQSPTLALPQFILRPETLFDRIGGALGLQDIDFETHPLFSKQFVLQAEDEQAVRELFRHELLTELEHHPGICVEADGNQVIVYRSGKRRKPEELHAMLKEVYQLYGLLESPKTPV